MDAPTRFGGGNALHPVHSAFKLELGVSSPAFHHENNLFEAAKLGGVAAENIHIPALGFCVAGIHPKERTGKKSSLLPTCTCPYFHNDVFLIVGILGWEQELQFFFQLLKALF